MAESETYCAGSIAIGMTPDERRCSNGAGASDRGEMAEIFEDMLLLIDRHCMGTYNSS